MQMNTSSSEVQVEGNEGTRLRSLLFQMQTEAAVLERIVYKNKNQHRRSSYFQYLLKVRRNLRLLLAAGLSDILNASFAFLDGRKSAQKALLPGRTKRKKLGEKHSYQERLLGVARLLSQMTESIIKAAIQISLLLGKSFFIGFSVMVMALLARIRVLVQQMLLDIVSVYNKVSDLSQIKQSIKLSNDGVEAFRDYYPSKKDTLLLECKWEQDKFMLVEKTRNVFESYQGEDQISPPGNSINYTTMDVFHTGNQVACVEEEPIKWLESSGNLDCKHTPCLKEQSCPDAASTSKAHQMRAGVPKLEANHLKRVAFVSVGKRAASSGDSNLDKALKKPRIEGSSPAGDVGALFDAFSDLPIAENTNTSIFL